MPACYKGIVSATELSNHRAHANQKCALTLNTALPHLALDSSIWPHSSNFKNLMWRLYAGCCHSLLQTMQLSTTAVGTPSASS